MTTDVQKTFKFHYKKKLGCYKQGGGRENMFFSLQFNVTN